MRRLGLVAVALLSLVAFAGGINLLTGTRFEFTDCASGGSVAQTLTTPRQYLLRVTDADVFLCFTESGSTCATGGEKFPSGTVILLNVTSDKASVSCRSSASTADAIFTSAN